MQAARRDAAISPCQVTDDCGWWLDIGGRPIATATSARDADPADQPPRQHCPSEQVLCGSCIALHLFVQVEGSDEHSVVKTSSAHSLAADVAFVLERRSNMGWLKWAR